MFSVESTEWRIRREWTDGKTKLEAQLPELLATILEFIPATKKARGERLEKERERAQEERRRWEAQRKRDEEAKQLDNLVKAEEQVARSEAALRFLDRLEAKLGNGSMVAFERTSNWLKHARLLAVEANPIEKWLTELRELDKSN